MNIYELAFFLSILSGPIAGGIVGKDFGALGVLCGVVGGLVISLVIHFSVLGLSVGLAKVGHSMEDPPKNRLLRIPWWLANFTSVALMILSPMGTVGAIFWIWTRLKQ